MKVNQKYVSFYYEGITEVPDMVFEREKTALLLVDLQKEFINRDMGDCLAAKKSGDWERWIPYHDRLDQIVIPNNKRLIEFFRKNNMEVTYGRIASLKKDGRDRAYVQKTIGWNNIYIHVDSEGAKMVDELAPQPDDIVVNKTTDSVPLSTNYTELMRNMGIDTIVVTGIVTDQCVANTVRVLADQGFKIVCVEDCCAAATMESHDAELKIMNILYCNVLSTDETIEAISKSLAQQNE